MSTQTPARGGSLMALDTGLVAPPARLRRADWRFLLPDPACWPPEHLVILGAADSLVERLRDIGAASRISQSGRPDGSANTVAILHDAQLEVRTAVAWLKPGGSLYWEVDRRSRRTLGLTPNRLARELRAAGLKPLGTYWVKPNFEQPEMYLPLESSGALRWYLRTLFSAVTPLRRLIEPALRALADDPRGRLAPLAPCYAMTAVAGPSTPGTPSVLSSPDLPAELKRPDLLTVMLSTGQDDRNRVVFLPFTARGTQPEAVLKITRLASLNDNVKREQVRLAEIGAVLDADLRRSIPAPLGIAWLDRLVVGVESYASGSSVSTSSGRWGVPIARKADDLDHATRWLVEFHRQTELERPVWGPVAIERWIDRPFAAFRQAFNPTLAERVLLASARQAAESLAGSSLPIVWQHHDFGEWNIYRDHDSVRVIDWESARVGLPLFDLLWFSTYWSFTVRNLRAEHDQLRGFRELFLEPDRGDEATRAVRGAIESYLSALNIDRRFRPVLLTCAWVEYALSRHERERVLDASGSPRSSANRYAQYVRILSEDADSLFANFALK